MLRKVAPRFGAPELLWSRLVPIAYQIYRLDLSGERPTYQTEPYWIVTTRGSTPSVEWDDKRGLSFIENAKKEKDPSPYDILVRVDNDETGVCVVTGHWESLETRHVRLLVTLLQRNGPVDSNELDTIVRRGFSEPRSTDSVGRNERLRDRLPVPLRSVVRRNGKHFAVQPTLRFCILRAALRPRCVEKGDERK